MSISRETAYRGRVVLRLDELERAKEIHVYNGRLWGLRRKMKRLKEARFGFGILTPLFFLAMLATCRQTMFENPALAAVVIAVTTVTYFFSLAKGCEIIHAAASALLLLLDIRFAILFAANAVLSVIIWRAEKTLKAQVGYPVFNEIEIVFEEPS